MAKLRVDKIAAPIVKDEYTGSVFFDGTGDELEIASSNDFAYGTGDFTWEVWIYATDLSGNHYIFDHGSNGGTLALGLPNGNRYYNTTLGTSGPLYDTGFGDLSTNTWYHLAAVRKDGTTSLYTNGVLMSSASDSHNYGAQSLTIGNYGAGSGGEEFDGYISNLRLTKGTALYTSNFIPPTRELEVTPETVLLACYDGENIFADKTGNHIIAAYGDRTSSPTPTATDSPIGSTTVTPGLTREVDPVEGPTFGGGVGFVSQNWLTLPKGTTEQRGRGRGLVGGGYITNYTNTIEYIEIHTLGNGQDFGDLSVAKAFVTTTSSSTRCVFHNGWDGSNGRLELEYVNISTTGNAVNFATSSTSQWSGAGCGNNTRGILASGSSNTIEYITFSTLGEINDFGDYTIGDYRDYSGCSSPTRGIFAGGFNPTNTNSIQYVTISTVGNSQDFGDLSSARGLGTGAASSATRGVFFGGDLYPNLTGTNIIEYITISTQGNATDFGDLTRSSYRIPCTSNGTRSVAYSSSPSPGSNIIEYVTIATTGNASDFGDSFESARECSDSASSDSHGGIS